MPCFPRPLPPLECLTGRTPHAPREVNSRFGSLTRSVRSTFCCGLAIVAVLLIASAAAAFGAAEPIEMHPKGQPLPFDHQGPFVTTGGGGVLAAGRSHAYKSDDEGKTWTAYPLFHDNEKYQARDERALIRLRDGTVVMAWMNERQRRRGGPWGQGGEAEAARWVLPVYVSRSADDGKTWTEPTKLQDRWCGAIRSLIQLESGRLVLVGQKVIPWRHVTLTYVSDDQGKTWTPSNLLDIEPKDGGDHSGTMEGTVAELTDGRVYMLIRTTKGWFWEAFSSDGGLTWHGLARSKLRSSTCCGQLARLASGRLMLLWNRPTDDDPHNIHSREELSAALSEDDGKTWTEPVIVSRRPLRPGEPYHAARQSYPHVYERRPGELWITTMQGGLRMKIAEADLVGQPGAKAADADLTVVAFGDSTTARRSGVASVYADLLRRELPRPGLTVRVVNQGIPGNNTNDALKRFDSDVRASKPDVVILLFGINDSMVDVWRDATEPRVPLATYRKNLTAMIRTLKADGATPILVTPQPMAWTEKLRGLYGGPPHHETSPYDPKDPLGLNATLVDYVEAVRDVAGREGVDLVDLYEPFTAHKSPDGRAFDTLLLDGMHPNDAGHRLIADALLPIITRHAERP